MDTRIAVDRRDLAVLASIFARDDAPREAITYKQFRETMIGLGFTTIPNNPFILFGLEANTELQTGSLSYNPDHAFEDEIIPREQRSKLAYVLQKVWGFSLDRFCLALPRD